MRPQTAQAAMGFLQRITMQPQEMEAFSVVMTELQEIAETPAATLVPGDQDQRGLDAPTAG
jgi:hypothetical protein